MHLKVNLSIACGGMVCHFVSVCFKEVKRGGGGGGGGRAGGAGGLEKQNEIESKAKIMGIVLTKLMTQLSSYLMSSVNYYLQ